MHKKHAPGNPVTEHASRICQVFLKESYACYCQILCVSHTDFTQAVHFVFGYALNLGKGNLFVSGPFYARVFVHLFIQIHDNAIREVADDKNDKMIMIRIPFSGSK